jgi:hypothetical protein
MNAKQVGLSLVLLDFLGLNAYVVYHYGYIGFFRMVLANAATTAVLVDLVIALSLITVWMWRDARERGVSVLPYALLTLLLGSAGPLAYLVRLLGSEERRARSLAPREAKA